MSMKAVRQVLTVTLLAGLLFVNFGVAVADEIMTTMSVPGVV